MTMHMPLLPDWLRYVWAAALVVVLVLHLRHAESMRGEVRLWHVGHILMAAGMIAMYLLPQADHPHLYWGGVALYGALTLAAGAYAATAWSGAGAPSWPWLASTVDMAVMTYMSLPRDDRPAWITYVAIAYLLVETLLWLVATAPSAAPPSDLPEAAADERTDGATATAVRTRPSALARLNRPESDVTLGVRTTLAIMSLSMAWMLLAMQTMHMAGGVAPGMHM